MAELSDTIKERIWNLIKQFLQVLSHARRLEYTILQQFGETQPLAVQDAAAVERMQSWAKSARPASTPMEVKHKSLRTSRFNTNN